MRNEKITPLYERLSRDDELLYCADCGGKMYVHRTNNGRRISQYTCSNYTKVPCGTLCSGLLA